MRILTIVENLGIGGTQRAAGKYARGYADLGHESASLGIYGGGELEKDLQCVGVQVFTGVEALPANLKRLKQWNPDLIHLHGSGAADPMNSWLLTELKTKKTRVLR